MLSGPVNNSCISVNNPILLSHVMKIQPEFIDTNNILKDGLSKVWFHLKEIQIQKIIVLNFKIFQKENTIFNKDASQSDVDVKLRYFKR